MFSTGIYEIKNLKTGTRYIGSTNDFKKRQTKHFKDLRTGKHVNSHLQADFNAYGEENFKFSILEYTLASQQFTREQFWINYYKGSTYNIATANANRKTAKNEFSKLFKYIWKWIEKWIF